MNDFSGKEAFEAFKELEFAHKGVTVIKGRSQHRGQPTLEALDVLAELEEVVGELFLLNFHDVIIDKHESVNSSSEFCVDTHNGLRKSFSLCVSNLELLQLCELLDGLSQLHDVLTSLDEGI